MRLLNKPHRHSGKTFNLIPICNCGVRGSYSEIFDAYYCRVGNCWIEGHCSDILCTFCKPRPQHPLPVKKQNAKAKKPTNNKPSLAPC
jgi:hypothetical protein